MNAQYKCVGGAHLPHGCGYAWSLPAPAQVDCPRCGNPYVRWVNYEKWPAVRMPKASAS